MTKPKKHKHISCLVHAKNIRTNEGIRVAIYELNLSQLGNLALKRWAKHFREHYCMDSTIDLLMEGGMCKTRKEYLLKHVFPNKEGFGPATRSGDFTEILMSDFVESIFNFWVPRTRFRLKQIPNESPKGSDIVGLKFEHGTPSKPSPRDALMTFEVKGLMNPDKNARRLQDAINDAKKDCFDEEKKGDASGAFRVGLTLNALKHRYIEAADDKAWKAVQRFQDPIGRPYDHKIGASAVFCRSAYDERVIREVTTTAYPIGSKPMLVVVKGGDMMNFIHAMYERAADEA